MAVLKVLPAWYVENNMEEPNVMDYTPLHSTVDLLLDIREELKANEEYGLDIETIDELIDRIEQCLALPEICDVVEELAPEYEPYSFDEDLPDNVIKLFDEPEDEDEF